tara:strand:- start:32 stop:958 length:927 start_codon:yes stop_codon:yes gene_type:complete
MISEDDLIISDEQPIGKKGGNWSIRRADIQFVIDCTQTMGFILEAIKSSIIEIVETYEKADITVRLGLTEFRDKNFPTQGYNSGYVHKFENSSYFTQDIEIFKKKISRLEATGGGPDRESCFDAIAIATMESDWDDGADSIIVFFSDAKPYSEDEIVKGGICGLCPIIKERKINQLHLVISEHDNSILDEYKDIFYCVPDTSNPDQGIPGGTYSIGKKDMSRDGSTGNLQDIKNQLKRIAKTSGRIIRGSQSSNPYSDDLEILIESNTSCFREKNKIKRNKIKRNNEEKGGKEKKLPVRNNNRGNPYL